jgi:hypothetical protein
MARRWFMMRVISENNTRMYCQDRTGHEGAKQRQASTPKQQKQKQQQKQ